MVKEACIALSFVVLLVPHPQSSLAQNAGKNVAAIPIVRHWQTVSDPNEGAFQIEVPQGWRIAGGTARRSALQYRLWATAISPDGSTVLSINDPAEPYFIAPSPMLNATGFPPGSVYSGQGNAYVVAPYMSGSQFAGFWGSRKLSSFCTSVTVTGTRERPDLGQRINSLSAGIGIFYDFGETTFSCTRNGVPMTASYLVSTLMTGGGTGGLWLPDIILSFVAPTPVAGMAAGTLAHIVKSFQISTTWAMGQSQTTAVVARINTQNNSVISDSIMSGWEQRGATIDRVMEEGSRARLGIDIYADPTTGTEYTVSNNSNHYWTDASGNIVGTESDNAPGAGYRKLSRVPPR